MVCSPPAHLSIPLPIYLCQRFFTYQPQRLQCITNGRKVQGYFLDSKCIDYTHYCTLLECLCRLGHFGICYNSAPLDSDCRVAYTISQLSYTISQLSHTIGRLSHTIWVLSYTIGQLSYIITPHRRIITSHRCIIIPYRLFIIP